MNKDTLELVLTYAAVAFSGALIPCVCLAWFKLEQWWFEKRQASTRRTNGLV